MGSSVVTFWLSGFAKSRNSCSGDLDRLDGFGCIIGLAEVKLTTTNMAAAEMRIVAAMATVCRCFVLYGFKRYYRTTSGRFKLLALPEEQSVLLREPLTTNASFTHRINRIFLVIIRETSNVKL
jgi:hypothetical protein